MLETSFPGAVSAGEVKPTTAATSAYRQGQAYERLFQDIDLSQGTCGIALERARCNADLQTISAVRGQDPTDALAAKWFATGDISLRVEKWNGMYVPDKAWADAPTIAWWYTAGLASIAASLPQGKEVDEYVGNVADALTKHSGAAPDDSQKWIPSGTTAYARLASVQTALQEVFPVEPYPAPAFGNGNISYVQLGIYVSTLLELVDNPFALSRPESRAFATPVLAQLQGLHRTFADGLTAAPLQAIVNQPIVADPQWLNTNWRQPLSQSINAKWPEGPRNSFLTGTLIAQVAYNAAVLKDAGSDAEFRGAISTLGAWKGFSAASRADIAAMQQVPYATKGGKWEDINAAATAATLQIVSEK